MKENGVPSCFSDESEYVIWLKYDAVSQLNGHKSNGFICKDCSVDYQMAMLKEGRCAHPEVQFGPVERKMNGVVEYEFAGYIQTGPKARLVNGYLPDTKQPEVVERERVSS